MLMIVSVPHNSSCSMLEKQVVQPFLSSGAPSFFLPS